MPTRCIEGEQIEFNLERYEAGNIYLIQNTLIEARIQILTSANAVPAKTVKVGPRNNVLHTLFDKCELHINEQRITNSSDNYAYKSYITTVLSYADYCKNSHLETQGWADDASIDFNSCVDSTNLGFKERSENFRVDFSNANDFRPDGAVYIGRLMHDLVSCETGLPPNTKVKFLLTKNKDSFILQCPSTDKEQYKVKITHICLYVPIAQISLEVYNEINSILSRKHEPKSIAIPYRRLEVRCLSIPVNKEEFYSDSMFTQTDLPCRIIICFVLAKAKLGSYHNNPYLFQRKWTYEVGLQAADPGRANLSLMNIEERFKKLENQLAEFLKKEAEKSRSERLKDCKDKAKKKSTDSPTKGGRKKRKKSSSESSNESSNSVEEHIRVEAQKRLRDFLQTSRDSDQASTSYQSCQRDIEFSNLPPEYQPTAPPLPSSSSSVVNERVTGTSKTVYLKKIEVLLNNMPLDQLDDSQTEDECIKSFYRMFDANGQANSLFSNSLNYKDFRRAYFFSCYDLLTSSKCGTSYVVPQIRVGNIRFR